jgi:hypothetical protein
LGVKKDAIRSSLLREEFYWRLAIRKPPISAKTQELRYNWALEHVN